MRFDNVSNNILKCLHFDILWEMNQDRVRLRRPALHVSTSRKQDCSSLPVDYTENGGALTPDVQGSSSPAFQKDDTVIRRIGKYLVFDGKESSGMIQTLRAVHLETRLEYTVKIMPERHYRELLAPYWAAGDHPHVSQICEILLDSNHAYVIFQRHSDDLHSYVRQRRKLREPEAANLFHQMVSVVKHCHSNGVILRDLKLRKFVFMDAERKHLLLEGLEEAHVLPDGSDDQLTDKHGCLAYVSPEILYSTEGYSGKSADIWSLGVVLYTMLVGQYPFHDSDVGSLFKKIRLGMCTIPDYISSLGKCLLRNLLRTDPSERLAVKEIQKHRWFSYCESKITKDEALKEIERVVPEHQPLFEIDLTSSLTSFQRSWNEPM